MQRLKSLITFLACGLAIIAAAFNVRALLQGKTDALVVLVFYTTYAILFAIRRPSITEMKGLKHWLVALGGTFLPFFVLHGGSRLALPWTAVFTLQGLQTLYMYGAVLSLGKSFGVIAAVRQIKTHGLYRFVRHPLYSAELLGFLLAVSQNASIYNMALLIIQVSCQLIRIQDEERLLRQDPQYEAYFATVRYRLIPGVY